MDEDEYTRITLRIPKDLHQKLAESAKGTSKSMNAEIVARLEASFDTKDQSVLLTTIAHLNLKLADMAVDVQCHRLNAAALANNLYRCILYIPPEDLNADPVLRALIEEWKSEANKFLVNIDEFKEATAEKFRQLKEAHEQLIAAQSRPTPPGNVLAQYLTNSPPKE